MAKLISGKRKPSKPLIIVGNGMVSWRLCRKLVELGVHQTRSIQVFGEEPVPAYDRVNLTKYFEQDSPNDLLLDSADWYRSNAISLHTGRRIVRLDRAAKLAVDDLGEAHPYGDCVLATGSRASVPQIEGVDSANVFVYRTIADIEAIQAAATHARRGLVVGGGLLGIEAANVLKDLGVETCIVQGASGLMSRQLDRDGASYLLREIASLGMSVRLKTRPEKISSGANGLEVSFDHGEPTEVDLVIFATGITARDELAAQSGLATAVRGGVIVNDLLQTADPSISAIGECVSHHGVVYGLVAPGYEMADCLAERLAGKKKTKYQGRDQSCRPKLLGVDVGTFGEFLQEGTYHVHRGESTYRSLLFRGSKLVGASVVGDWAETAEIERAVKAQRSFGPKARLDFERSGDLIGDVGANEVLFWPDEALVCNCTRTSAGQLREAVGAGCLTVDALTARTGAGSVCGSCLPQLAKFVGVDTGRVLDAVQPKGQRILLLLGVLAFLVTLAFIFLPAIPPADSVQGAYYKFTQLWQDSLIKQITGYTIAGLSLFALFLSARKRFRWLSFGNYGFWRAAHSWLGALTLIGVFLHTGLSFGDNLNLWLLICFLGLNLAGGLAAIAVATEKRFAGPLGGRLRALSTKAHIIFFMPYPILLGFHIAKVYLY